MDTLRVIAPNICVPEIEYTLNILLKEFLGIDYELIHSENQLNFDFCFGNESFSIKNHFFKSDRITDLYTLDTIPNNVTKDEIIIKGKTYPLVSIFGDIDLQFSSDRLELGLDLISSSFFMLTRWEEYVTSEKDTLGRCDPSYMLSVKRKFINRCVVNEYVELLWCLIVDIGYPEERKVWSFDAYVTHDIDTIQMWKKTRNFIGSLKLALSYSEFDKVISFFMSFFNVFKGKYRDPYLNLLYLSDSTDNRNISSTFYFKTGRTDFLYDKNEYAISDLENEIKVIQSRNQRIGIHPSFLTGNDESALSKEINTLSNYIKAKVLHSRQHYLRVYVPETFQILEESNIESDSSMMYSSTMGFRNGTCFPFSTFNFISRKKLNLKEIPLNFMETTCIYLYKLSEKEIVEKAKSLISEVKKYDGIFTMVWHNSNLVYNKHISCYETILDYIVKCKEKEC